MAGPAVSPSHDYRPMRRWARFKIDVPIRIVASKQEDKTAIVDGRGRDVSEGGIMVFAGLELKVDDVVEIEFTPPFGGPLRVGGIVRNRSGYYYGIEFLRDNEHEIARASRLREMLHSMSSGLEEA
jgi:PilZ domain